MRTSIPASASAEVLWLDEPRQRSRSNQLARRFLADPGGLLGLGITLVATLVALFAQHIAPYTPALLDVPPLRPPSLAHPMGTDQLGRDMLSAVLLGARTAMTVVAGVAASTAALGIVLGALAASAGGVVDDAITRVAELIQSVPRFFLAILAVGYFGSDLGVLIVLLSLTSWPFLARVVRAEALSVVEREFIEAARSLGASRTRVLLRHVVPNILPSALVVVALVGARVILLESSLSFLGLGDPEVTSWGFLLNNAQGFLDTAWWMAVFPGLAIVAVVLGLNLLSEAVADLLSPVGACPTRFRTRRRLPVGVASPLVGGVEAEEPTTRDS